jgi:hypothetical protein
VVGLEITGSGVVVVCADAQAESDMENKTNK